eukprot:2725628-Prymnesium_polylepis.1
MAWTVSGGAAGGGVAAVLEPALWRWHLNWKFSPHLIAAEVPGVGACPSALTKWTATRPSYEPTQKQLPGAAAVERSKLGGKRATERGG